MSEQTRLEQLRVEAEELIQISNPTFYEHIMSKHVLALIGLVKAQHEALRKTARHGVYTWPEFRECGEVAARALDLYDEFQKGDE